MKRSSSRPLHILSTAIVLLILGLATLLQSGFPGKKAPSPKSISQPFTTQSPSEYSTLTATVIRVIDGDTFSCSLDNGLEERVRLLGIDTPESRRNEKVERDSLKTGASLDTLIALGKKSSNYTKSLLPKGTQIQLETDVQIRDRYGRLLAYVYLPDGQMLNALLVKEGYAQIMSIPPNVRYQDQFLSLQKEARENQRGLWKTLD